MKLTALRLPPWREFYAVHQTDQQKHCAPPHVGVQVEENYVWIYRRIYHLVDSCGTNQRPIHGQRDANKEPD
jgi:hypothetical protein